MLRSTSSAAKARCTLATSPQVHQCVPSASANSMALLGCPVAEQVLKPGADGSTRFSRVHDEITLDCR